MAISYKYYSHLTKEMRGFINKNRIARFDLLVTSGEARVAAPLSPILGQFGLSCQEFCNKFNAETEELLSGLPIRLKFTAYPQDREFKYIFLGISFTQIISSTFTESINFLELYKIYLIYKQFFDYNFKGSLKDLKIIKSLIGCLKTLHLYIRLFYN
jgi:hypothetical protein